MSRHSHHHAVIAPAEVLDPVCGMTVEESKAAGRSGYAGQMFYFCSSNCQRNFELNPAVYVARLGAR